MISEKHGKRSNQRYHERVLPNRHLELHRLKTGGWKLYWAVSLQGLGGGGGRVRATTSQEAYNGIIWFVVVLGLFVVCPVMVLGILALDQNSILGSIAMTFFLVSLANFYRSVVKWSTFTALGLIFLGLVAVIGLLGAGAIFTLIAVTERVCALVKASQKVQMHVRILQQLIDTATEIQENEINIDCESGTVWSSVDHPLFGVYLSDQGLDNSQLWEPHSACLFFGFLSTAMGWEILGGRREGFGGQKTMVIQDGFVSCSTSRAAYWVEASPAGRATAICRGRFNAQGEFQGTRTVIIYHGATTQLCARPCRLLPISNTNCQVHHMMQCGGCHSTKPMIGLCESCMAMYKEGSLVAFINPPVPAHEMIAIETVSQNPYVRTIHAQGDTANTLDQHLEQSSTAPHLHAESSFSSQHII